MSDEITPASILEDWLVLHEFDRHDRVDGYVRCAHCCGRHGLHGAGRSSEWKLEHNYSGAYKLVLRHMMYGAQVSKINHQRFNEHRSSGMELEICLVKAGGDKPSNHLA